MADGAPKVAAKLNQEQLQPRADYLADHFEEKARAFAKRLGPLAAGLPDSIEKAVKKNKVGGCTAGLQCVVVLRLPAFLQMHPERQCGTKSSSSALSKSNMWSGRTGWEVVRDYCLLRWLHQECT